MSSVRAAVLQLQRWQRFVTSAMACARLLAAAACGVLRSQQPVVYQGVDPIGGLDLLDLGQSCLGQSCYQQDWYGVLRWHWARGTLQYHRCRRSGSFG
jgi:hypothetical protein